MAALPSTADGPTVFENDVTPIAHACAQQHDPPPGNTTLKNKIITVFTLAALALLLASTGCGDETTEEQASTAPECEQLATCCGGLAGGDTIQGACMDVANANSAQRCSDVHEAYTGSAMCGDARSADDACATLQTGCCDGAAMPDGEKVACEATVADADAEACDHAITQYTWLSYCGDTPPLRGNTGAGFDFACCCFQSCADNSVCLPQYFSSFCSDGNAGDYCTLEPTTPTQDPSLVHPFWFLYSNGWFSGVTVPCDIF